MAIDLTKYKSIDFAGFVQQHGYSDRTSWARAKSSKNYPAFENTAHNDRIIVKRDTNAYFDAQSGTGKYRDLINFVEDRLETVFRQFRSRTDTRPFFTALKILDGHVQGHGGNSPPVVNAQQAAPKNGRFNLGHFLTEKLPETNWLSKLHLPESTLNSHLFRGKILFVRNPVYDESYKKVVRHSYGNVSFPYVREPDGDIVGFEQRNHNYKGHAIFSDKKTGAWFSNPTEETKFLLVTESAKDALAHHAIYQSRDILYCSVGGNFSVGQIETINSAAKKLNLVRVMGFDNDIAGNVFALQYILHDLNPMNRVRNDQKKGEVSFNIVDTESSDMYDGILKSFDTKDPLSPTRCNNEVLSFSIPAEMEVTTKLIYAILKTNRKVFEGKLMLQRPKEKDFYDCFLKKINTYQRQAKYTPGRP